MLRGIWMLLALALLLGSVGPARADLIQNGGFETGTFSGWTSNNQPSLLVEPSPHLVVLVSHSGNYYANFGSNALGTISQTINDTAGATYTLSMYLLSDGGINNEFIVQWNGTKIYDMTNLPSTLNNPSPYTLLSFTVQGTGNDILTLSGKDNGSTPGALALDDVSLTPSGPTAAPAPSSLAMLSMASATFAGYFGWRRRRQLVTA